MSLENFLSLPIQALQEVVFTPILSLVAILSFMLLLITYHLSGLSEKVENLNSWKKFLALLFVTLVVFVFYYIFYKAGKFDKILSYPVADDLVEKVKNLINR